MKLFVLKNMARLPVLLALLVSCIAFAEEGVADKAISGIKKGGESAGQGIKKGVDSAGKEIKKGADATGKGLKQSGDWVGKKLDKVFK